jgi:ADP-glucose pyrophosphorylase
MEAILNDIMEKEWLDMIKSFLKLTPEQRVQESQKRLDQSLERLSKTHHISVGDAYEMLITNRDRIYRQFCRRQW